MAQSFQDRDPRPFGMDAAVEFPPHKLTDGLSRDQSAACEMLDRGATARVYAYADVAAASDTAPADYPLIRTVLPGWDNDARRQGAGMVGARRDAGRLPGLAVAAGRRRRSEQPVHGEALVCVNAWNEWAEGAYLEPDVHFGAAFLNATARAVAGEDAGARRDAAAAGRARRVRRRVAAAAAASRPHLAGGEGDRRRLPAAVGRRAGGEISRGRADHGAGRARTSCARHAQSMLARGFTAAIVNTAAAGAACAQLTQAGVVVHAARARAAAAAARARAGGWRAVGCRRGAACGVPGQLRARPVPGAGRGARRVRRCCCRKGCTVR